MTSQLQLIQEHLETLKPSEKKVAAYILQQPEEVMNSSVHKVAEQTEVSVATIVRLAKKLNCKGFQDLKLKIAYDMAKGNHEKEYYEDIPKEDSIQGLMHSVSQSNIQSIQNSMQVLSEEELEKAIDLISNARIVAIYGIGASGVIARDFKQKLTRINKWCEAAEDRDTQVTISANLTEADVAIGVSYSGQTLDIIESLNVAKENGANIISLTKYGENDVTALADVKLQTTSLEGDIRSGATSSRIATLNVIDMLYLGVTRFNKEDNIEALERTRKAVEVLKKNV
ncbi:SIS domain-containing protein [Pontibacillus yanchengensis]|uniref:SIS domain-containing protein n=2 Tax=Pontibacillus yanchengensis TaxID=462910 RepID=A0ACC7VGN4_9BACI|nr:MurR/RpiR family transcriptional regulator [Pontibacillus yanchengensis]MYL33910.1 SIS domain-containing protein [Pontibacillus yanchengensis]MYL53943.1 SIS domain-containing protein [Pontibacillus yanchengensis]